MLISFYEKKSQLYVNKFSDNLAGFLYPYDRCAPVTHSYSQYIIV